MNEEICEIVITGPSIDGLLEFTRRLVRLRLVACGQAVREVTSIYWWQGEVQEDSEARVALHTRLSLVPQIVAQANDWNLADVPCVIALPVIAANPAYAQWVLTETSQVSQS